MKFLKMIGKITAILGVLLAIGLAVALWVYRDIPAETLEAKYANETSRFINIDGVRIHYRDEGEGPAVLLLACQFRQPDRLGSVGRGTEGFLSRRAHGFLRVTD